MQKIKVVYQKISYTFKPSVSTFVRFEKLDMIFLEISPFPSVVCRK